LGEERRGVGGECWVDGGGRVKSLGWRGMEAITISAVRPGGGGGGGNRCTECNKDGQKWGRVTDWGAERGGWRYRPGGGGGECRFR